MQIDNTTLTVLKHFSKINPSLTIHPGNTLKTISKSSTVLCTANVKTSFESKFSIGDLDRFISALSLFSDPELTFNKDHLVIIDSFGKTVKYVFADERVIIQPPTNIPRLPEKVAEVTISNEVFKSVDKAKSILDIPNIVIVGDGFNVYIKCLDMKNSTSDNFSMKIGETDKNFSVVFKHENLKLIPVDYNVTLYKGIAQFVSVDGDIEYFIAIEDKSKYE
jgi:hypothetical protein